MSDPFPLRHCSVLLVGCMAHPCQCCCSILNPCFPLVISYSSSLLPFYVERYKLGDAFLHVSQPKALQLLENDTSRVDQEIERLEKIVDECEDEMKKLKVTLYGKFGNNISESRARPSESWKSH